MPNGREWRPTAPGKQISDGNHGVQTSRRLSLDDVGSESSLLVKRPGSDRDEYPAAGGETGRPGRRGIRIDGGLFSVARRSLNETDRVSVSVCEMLTVVFRLRCSRRHRSAIIDTSRAIT